MGNHHPPHKSKYEKSGIYQITYPTCNMKYTGQTDWSFNTRFREHMRDFKKGYNKIRFAQNLLENRHAIGNMNDIMDTLFFTNKGRLMDAVESFYIFRETKLDNQLNDKLTVKHNIIFETIVREDPHRGIYDTCSTQQHIPPQSDLSATWIHWTALSTSPSEVIDTQSSHTWLQNAAPSPKENRLPIQWISTPT